MSDFILEKALPALLIITLPIIGSVAVIHRQIEQNNALIDRAICLAENDYKRLASSAIGLQQRSNIAIAKSLGKKDPVTAAILLENADTARSILEGTQTARCSTR